MGSSYREECIKYKDQRRMLAEDMPILKGKKKKARNKKSNHKHQYRPMIFMRKGRRPDGTEYICQNTGFACEICGRVQHFYFLWGSDKEEQINNFKLKNPNYMEITLPENWDIFKDKNIPI